MKKPSITDLKVKKYVEYLERKLKEFQKGSTDVDSYLALSNYIAQGNKIMKALEFDGTEMSDKDDKVIDRATKFSDKILENNQNLKDLFSMIGIEEKKEIEEGTKKAASAYEAAMPDKK